MIKALVFFISWICIGFTTFIVALIMDLRGSEYEEKYFDNFFSCMLGVTILGYISPVMLVLIIVHDKYEETLRDIKIKMFRNIWKVANMEVKKKDD